MRRILASIIGLMCSASAAWALSPAVTATVTTAADSVVYTYTLTNTTSDNIWQFAIFIPRGAADTIISHTTSQDGWSTLIRKAGFDTICWDRHEDGVVAPRSSADYSFATATGVPTTSTFDGNSSTGSSNWGWWNGLAGGSGEGNTILPVPMPIPEPSSLVALAGGLVSLLGLSRRRG